MKKSIVLLIGKVVFHCVKMWHLPTRVSASMRRRIIGIPPTMSSYPMLLQNI